MTFKRGSKAAAVTTEAPVIKADATPAPASVDSLARLKEVAGQFKSYINQQYQAEVAYVPDEDAIASWTVTKWLSVSEDIDAAMGLPGLPFGCITQCYGKKDSGKTSLLMQAIAACQRQGILPILVLSEFKFDFSRLPKWMGGDPEAMIVFPADTLEDGFRFVEQILRGIATGKLNYEEPNPDFDEKKKEGKDNSKTRTRVIDIGNTPCFVFWDSIGGTLSDSEADGNVEDWDKDMGRGAQAIKKMVKRSVSLLQKVRERAGVLFLNQVWTARTPQGVSYDKPSGGEAVQHYYALEIHMKRKDEISMTLNKQDMGIGYRVMLCIKKNHITHNRLESPMIAVAEGLLAPTQLEAFKVRFKKKIDEAA